MAGTARRRATGSEVSSLIPLAEPTLGDHEVRYLGECLDSGFVSTVGPFIERFEREFAEHVGAPYAVACASGTAALHVALRVAGAGPSRLVAVSDFTFIASANAISYTGADLLLVDSEPGTWNMNTEFLYDEVVRRARKGDRIPDVVEVVHVLGHPAFIEPLLALRDRFGISLVEDAAESLGATWTSSGVAGRQVGTVGDFGCFSFNGNKIITTGGGGMIVTEDAELANQARHLTMQAKLAGEDYVHDTIGYNYRLTNLAAALGVAQIQRLPELLQAKRKIASRYNIQLQDLPITLAPSKSWAKPTYWLYSLLLDEESVSPAEMILLMEAEKIRARRLWPPLHEQAPYRGVERIGGTTALDIHRRGLSLPSSASLAEHDQITVTSTLEALLS